MTPNETPLILASTSRYRKALLARLKLPFSCRAPDFAELDAHTMPEDFTPQKLVRHNTLGKARAVRAIHPEAAVIASDQIAVCNGRILEKPGGHAAAREQLAFAAGKNVDFLTGVCLLAGQTEKYALKPFQVRFRHLTDDEIGTYLRLDEPWDCAGSFKAESLGIALFEKMQGDDPSALTGLPLITLSGWLQPLSARNGGKSRTTPSI